MSEFTYSTIAVTGRDAFGFLQNQLAADMRKVPDGGPLLAAWCNPKGRVICLFRVTAAGDGYRLALPSELVDDVVRRLTRFRFRAKVEVEAGPVRAADLGSESPLAEWRLRNLRAGIAEIGAAQTEQFTPHMLNLDLIGAASVDKGCYPGQEIVARTYYRGATKRRLHRYASSAPATVGTKVSDGLRDVGEVVNAIGRDFLAVVPIDLADTGLSVDGAPLTLRDLPYLQKQ